MFRVIGSDIGPFEHVDIEFKKFNLVFGAIGTGKSFLFRLLVLAWMSMDIARLRSEDTTTAFARLIALDDGAVTEALTLGRDVIGFIASQAILRHGSRDGFLKLYCGDKLLIDLFVDSEGINLRVDDDIKSAIYIHIPQERPLNNIVELLYTAGRDYLDLARKYGYDIAVDFLLLRLLFERKFNPILAKFLVDLAASIGHIMEFKKSTSVIADIEGASKRRLKLFLSTIESRATLSDEIGLSIAIPSTLRVPMGVLEAGFVKVIMEGLTLFLQTEKNLKALLVIDEFAEHCDPVLTQKLLDYVVDKTMRIDNLYTVIITHNPDILTRSIRIFEELANSRPGIEKQCSIQRFIWSPEKRYVDVKTSTLERIDNVLRLSEPIEILEESFRYLEGSSMGSQ